MKRLYLLQGKKPFSRELLHTEKKTSFVTLWKGCDSMFYVILHANSTANSTTFKKSKVQNPVPKVLALFQEKVMTMFSTSMKEKERSKMLESLGKLIGKRGKYLSSLIRIELEDIKGKVRAQSPAALQFIGPGDR